MGVKLRRWANDHRLFLWLLGLGFLVLESVAHLFGPGSHWGELLFHLGLVGGIASVSSFGVDRYLKREFAKDIASDVASQVFVFGLRKEVAEEVDWARRLGVVRVNTRMAFSFLPYFPPGSSNPDPNFVKLATTVKFALENHTDNDFPFKHRCAIRDALIPLVDSPFEVFECAHTPDVSNSGYRINQNGLVPAQNPNGDWSLEKEVVIKPNKGNVRHTFIHKCQTVYRIDGQELFTFNQPTIGCEVAIEANPLGLQITPIILHRSGKTNVTAIPQENPTEFKFEHAFLGPAVLTLVWKKP